MPLSRRYTPEHAPGDGCAYGMSFEYIIPPGVGIASGSVAIFRNVVPPSGAATDWDIGPVLISGRTLFANLAGGTSGVDYQIAWTALDTEGNQWTRTGLVLVTPTS